MFNEDALICKFVLLSIPLCLFACEILHRTNLPSLFCDLDIFSETWPGLSYLCSLCGVCFLHDGACSLSDGLVFFVLLCGCVVVGGGGVGGGFATE